MSSSWFESAFEVCPYSLGLFIHCFQLFRQPIGFPSPSHFLRPWRVLVWVCTKKIAQKTQTTRNTRSLPTIFVDERHKMQHHVLTFRWGSWLAASSRWLVRTLNVWPAWGWLLRVAMESRLSATVLLAGSAQPQSLQPNSKSCCYPVVLVILMKVRPAPTLLSSLCPRHD